MAAKRGVGAVRASTPSAPAKGSQGTTPTSERGFLTDVEVTGARFGGRERQLQAWGADDGSGGLDDSASVGLESQPSRGVVKGANGQWDQFATNEKLYGLKTDYNEEFYTTKLDRTGADYRAREAKAAQLEREILKGTGSLASNAHMAEERGVAGADDSGLDEEDRQATSARQKYGAVIRGPDAYVPPGARKAWQPKTQSATATPPAASTNGGSTAPSPAPPAAAAAASPAVTATASAAASAAARHADPAILSTSRVPASITKAGTAAAAPAAGSAASKKDAPPLHTTFQQFVSTERERLQQKRQAVVKLAAKQEQDSKLQSLLEFSQNFKLPKPVPDDISTLLGKKPSSTATTPAVSPTPQARTLAAASPIAAATPTPAVKVSLPTKAAPTARLSPASALQLPAIPPFKGKPSTPTASPAPAAAVTPSASPAPTLAPKASASKISATAAPFVFKPNPNASSFTPTLSAAGSPSPAARKLSDAGSVASTTPAASPSVAKTLSATAQPFFTKPIKKGSASLRVKEDFTPFKNGVVPEPMSIIPQWSQFTGKSFRSLYPGEEGGPEQISTPAPGGPNLAPHHHLIHPGGGPVPQGFNPYQQYQPPNFQQQRGGPGGGGFPPGPPPGQPQLPPHMVGGPPPPPPGMNPQFHQQFAAMGGFVPGNPMFNPQQQGPGGAPNAGQFLRYNPAFVPGGPPPQQQQQQGGAQPAQQQQPMGFVEGGPGGRM